MRARVLFFALVRRPPMAMAAAAVPLSAILENNNEFMELNSDFAALSRTLPHRYAVAIPALITAGKVLDSIVKKAHHVRIHQYLQY